MVESLKQDLEIEKVSVFSRVVCRVVVLVGLGFRPSGLETKGCGTRPKVPVRFHHFVYGPWLDTPNLSTPSILGSRRLDGVSVYVVDESSLFNVLLGKYSLLRGKNLYPEKEF